MNYFKSIYAILKKDILMEIKSKEVLNSMLVFALLVTVVFSFVFEPGSQTKNEVVGGIFWVAVVFSGLLGLGKTIVSEVQGGNLEALLLSPVDRSAIFFGKFLSNFIFLLVMEAILLPLFTVFYSINILTHYKIIIIMIIQRQLVILAVLDMFFWLVFMVLKGFLHVLLILSLQHIMSLN